MSNLSLIIPCYNEVDNVGKLRDELFPIVCQLLQPKSLPEMAISSVEVIFVDDGSKDGTGLALQEVFGQQREVATSAAVTVHILVHPVNRGLGAALRTGFAAASGDIIVTTDSDGTYSFAEIPALLSHLTPDVDIVTASPYHAQGDVDGVPGYRLFLSKGASALYRLLADRRVHTYTALFRAYRRSVIKNVPFESNGFLGGTELLVNAMRMGYQVAEYPTVLHSRVHGQSKAKLARTIRAHLHFQAEMLLPWHPYGTIIRGSGETVYLYVAGEKRPFPNPEAFLSHGYYWQQIVQFPDAFLDVVPTGVPMPFRDGTLWRGSDKTVYVIEHGRKRAILSPDIFAGLGYQWHQVRHVANEVVQTLETGPEVATTDRHPDWTVVKSETEETIYVLDGGRKRPFPSKQVFFSWNYTWKEVVAVESDVLARYPTGPEIEAQPPFDTNLITAALAFTTSLLCPTLPVARDWRVVVSSPPISNLQSPQT
jgi:dolichol-phosphate mannosyltransferase